MIKFYKALDDMHFEEYYQMKCLKNNIFNSGFSKAPDKDLLYSNFMNKIKSIKYDIFFLLKNDQVLSQSQIEYSEINSCEISYASLITGHGYGNRIVCETKKYCFSRDINNVFMYIADINYISILIAEKNGFIKSDYFEMRYNQMLKRDIRYNKWALSK